MSALILDFQSRRRARNSERRIYPADLERTHAEMQVRIYAKNRGLDPYQCKQCVAKVRTLMDGGMDVSHAVYEAGKFARALTPDTTPAA